LCKPLGSGGHDKEWGMMPPPKEEYVLNLLLKQCPQIEEIDDVFIENGIIHSIRLGIVSIGSVIIHKLDIEDAPALFEFYTRGLSEKARSLFYPYPLFNPRPRSVAEFSKRILDWKKEDDWVVLNLVKDRLVLGVALLKRIRSENATSGLAVRDDFCNMKLGQLLQTIVNVQARLLGLKRFHVKIEPNNIASMRVHEKCGFRKGGLVSYFGYRDGEKVEMPVVEMVKELAF